MNHTLRFPLRLLYAAVLLLGVLAFSACSKPRPVWNIGVSQCSDDAWRAKLNRELTIAGYASDDIRLHIVSANDNSALQAKQIERFVAEGMDLIFISPNSSDSLVHAIDKAYDAGIPVVLFDRHTKSNKYTAYIGADNYVIGFAMGQCVANRMGGRGVVAELQGLQGSSAAIDRHRGFSDALSAHPAIRVISAGAKGWTMRHGEEAMTEILQRSAADGRDIDCVFGHNDRLALGARHVAMREGLHRILYFGVDGLPSSDGGIEAVASGKMEATYIYPTQGLEMVSLARQILTHQQFQRVNILESATIDHSNAQLMALQYREMERASEDLEMLDSRVDTYFTRLHVQQRVIAGFIIVVVIIILLTLLLYRSYLAKARLHDELTCRHQELSQLYRQMEDIADARLLFFTQIGHRLRTPLTLLVAPVETLLADRNLPHAAHELVEMMQRNLRGLTTLVDRMLDPKSGDAEVPAPGEHTPGEHPLQATEQGVDDMYALDPYTPDDGSPEDGVGDGDAGEREQILVVDDNPDVRKLLRSILHNAGYAVHLAADGQQGYEAARTNVPDLIVSDVMMPVMDGLEMCRRVKADAVTCHIPLLMLTARTLDEHRVEGYRYGADAYLTKPFSPAILTARIANLLANRRSLIASFAHESAPVSGDVPALSAAGDPENDSSGTSSASGDAAAAADVSAVQMPQQETAPRLSPRDEAFMARFSEIVCRHLSDADFGVEDACSEMAMSRVQLYRKVKALTGNTPVELLRRARVGRAHELLLTTDKSISEVAYACGFSAPSYFNKCFKDEYGITPGELRPASTEA